MCAEWAMHIKERSVEEMATPLGRRLGASY
jgi:hypothetical protein